MHKSMITSNLELHASHTNQNHSALQSLYKKETEQDRTEKKKKLHRKITSNLIYFLSLPVYSGLNSPCITAVSLLSTKPSPMAQLPQCLLCLRWVSKAFSFHTSFTARCCDFRKSVGFYQANKWDKHFVSANSKTCADFLTVGTLSS